MRELQRNLGLTYLIITHNLHIVGHIADRIAVMYLGQLVEVGAANAVLEDPCHPYTQGLFAAVSDANPRAQRYERRLLLPGEIPSPRNPPPGCRFHTRCRLLRKIVASRHLRSTRLHLNTQWHAISGKKHGLRARTHPRSLGDAVPRLRQRELKRRS